jgi:hypothetical protein
METKTSHQTQATLQKGEFRIVIIAAKEFLEAVVSLDL